MISSGLPNTTPKVQGGIGLSGQYKDFDFNANFTYMLDYDINNATAYTLSSSQGNKNRFLKLLEERMNIAKTSLEIKRK